MPLPLILGILNPGLLPLCVGDGRDDWEYTPSARRERRTAAEIEMDRKREIRERARLDALHRS